MAESSATVAYVSFIEGEVKARDAKGQIRILQLNDPIHEGDVLITGQFSTVVIALADETTLTIGEQQVVAVDEQVLTSSPDPSAASVSTLEASEAETVVKMLGSEADRELAERSFDSLSTEDPGSGPNFVNLLRIVEAVPVAAYEFPSNPTGTPPVIEAETAVRQTFRDDDEILIVEEDSGPATGNLLEGTSSVDGPLSIKSFSIAGEAAGSSFVLGSPYIVAGKGTLNVNSDGSYSFTPADNWNGRFPVVSYVVTDGSGNDDNSTLSITVTPVNDDFSDAHEILTVAEDSGATTGTLLSGTSSVDGPVSIKSFSIAGEAAGSSFVLGSPYIVAGKGTLTVNSDGSYSFTPANNWNGSFPVVSYVVTDGSGSDDNSTLSITVTPVNDDFSDADETLRVAEDSSASTGNLLSGTSSVDGPVSIKSFSIAGEAAGSSFTLGSPYTVAGKGTLTVNSDGSYSFTPAPNWNGNFPVVSYVVTDGSGTDNNSTLSITVTPVNDDFSDSDEILSVSEDSGATTGNLLSGTSSVDGPVSIKSFSIAGEAGGSSFTLGTGYTVAGKGTLTVNSDGSYSFTPADNWNGSFPVVSYVVTDGSGSDNSSTLSITVTPVNDDFSDADETLTVAEDSGATTGSLLTGTSSVDGPVSIKSFSIAGEAAGSNFALGTPYTVAGKGTLTVNSDGSYSFTPTPNWNGSFPVVTYTVTDGSGTDNSSTLSITVTPVNDDFSDADETLTVAEDSGATTGNLLSGTSSVDGPVSIKSFSIAGEAAGSSFLLGTTYTVAGKGTLTVNGDGSYSFTPAPNWNGNFPVVSYVVTDGSGTDNNSTLSIAVTPVNDDFSDADEILSVSEDSGATTGNLLSGTSSVDGPVSIKSFSIAGEAAGSSFTLGSPYTVAGKGTLTVNSDGSYSFTPADNWNGRFPVVSYVVTDGSGTDNNSTLSITVTPVNDDFSDADETLTVAEDSGATTGSLLTGTSSVDGPVSIKSFSIAGEAAGSSFVLGSPYIVAGKGTLTLNSDGSYSFTPADNWNGSFPVVSYMVTDGSGTDDDSTLSITVTPLNDDFSDANETLTVAEDSGATTGSVLTGTSSVDGPVSIKSFSIAGEAAGSSFTLGSPYSVVGKGTLTVNGDGSYSFTPAPNWNGSFPVVSYVVTDGSGSDDSSTLSITVTPVNDDFSDADEILTVDEDSGATTGTLLSDTSSVDGPVSIKSFSIAGEAAGSSFVLGSPYIVAGKGTLTVNSDGSYSFTPADNWNGSFPVVSYVVTDGSGTDNSSTLSITVTPVNDDFSDADETLTVAEDSGATTGNLLSGTSSVDGPVSIRSFSIAGEAAGSSFSLGTPYTVADKGTLTVNSDGSYSFTPADNWNGSFPVVSYVVTDGSGTDNNSTLSITVTPVNDDFSDADETLSVVEDSGASTGNLLSGTSSVDGPVSIRSFSIAGEADGSNFTLGSPYSVSGKGTLTVNGDGSYSFTPAPNWNGSFPVVSYVVTDGSGTDNNSTLSIIVTPVNDDFSDANETLTVAEDSGATTGDLLSGTISVDGPVSIKSFSIAGEADGSNFTLGSPYSVAGKGTLTVNSDGTYSFTPVPDWNGSFPVVSYVVTDGSGTDDSSTLSIAVTPLLDAKVTVNENYGFNAVQFRAEYQEVSLNMAADINSNIAIPGETSTVTLRLTSTLPDGVSFLDSRLQPDSEGFIYTATGLTALQAKELVSGLKMKVWDDALVDGIVTVTSTDGVGITDTYSSSAYFRLIVTNEQKTDGNGDANNLNVSLNDSDTLVQGYGGNDTITGSSFNDWLFGDSGNDLISSGPGNDKIWGGGGSDTLTGGDGRDTFIFELADMLFAKQATDTIKDFGRGGDTLMIGNLLSEGGTLEVGSVGTSTKLSITDNAAGFSETIVLAGYQTTEAQRASILAVLRKAGQYEYGYDKAEDYLVGGNDGDTLVGGDAGNVLIGRNGKDSLSGAGGNDILYGGVGEDTLSGGNDDDVLMGENNNDVLKGDSGADFLSGGQGNDSLEGGDGADTLSGGNDDDRLMGEDGADVLMGDGGADSLYGGLGNDSLSGGQGNDSLSGGDDADTLRGGSGEDVLSGDGGNDIVSGGQGSDTLSGGEGADTFVFELVDLNSGVLAIDTITDFGTGDTLQLNDLLSGGIMIDSLEAIGSNTVLHIMDDTLTEIQTIVLQGYTVVDPATILNALAASVDHSYTAG